MPPRKKTSPDDHTIVKNLIERIASECPRRQPTSEDERRAQIIMKEEFEKLDLPTGVEPFRFNDNLYANIALHFGIGTLGTAVSGVAPLAGFALHMLAGSSYWNSGSATQTPQNSERLPLCTGNSIPHARTRKGPPYGGPSNV